MESKPVMSASRAPNLVQTLDRPVVAVLPFKNLNSEADSERLVDGLTDDIIRRLAGVPGLQVVSGTSSFAFKHQPRNLREVAERLGANLVVEGSVLTGRRQLRVNASLVRVANDRFVWADHFDRSVEDLVSIQDEITEAIVHAAREREGSAPEPVLPMRSSGSS
jgi:adenylate cyclase